MRLSELKPIGKQSPKEISDYREANLFSDDLLSFGGERIIESKLLFHGALAAKETEETARNWDLRLQVIHLGDYWEGDCWDDGTSEVAFLNSDRERHDLTPNDSYIKLVYSFVNNNILAIRTEYSVVILHRFWAFNESSQYPEELRNIDNESHIFRTGGYSVYKFPADQWGRIIGIRNFEEYEEWENVMNIDDLQVISHWQGFGNI